MERQCQNCGTIFFSGYICPMCGEVWSEDTASEKLQDISPQHEKHIVVELDREEDDSGRDNAVEQNGAATVSHGALGKEEHKTEINKAKAEKIRPDELDGGKKQKKKRAAVMASAALLLLLAVTGIFTLGGAGHRAAEERTTGQSDSKASEIKEKEETEEEKPLEMTLKWTSLGRNTLESDEGTLDLGGESFEAKVTANWLEPLMAVIEESGDYGSTTPKLIPVLNGVGTRTIATMDEGSKPEELYTIIGYIPANEIDKTMVQAEISQDVYEDDDNNEELYSSLFVTLNFRDLETGIAYINTVSVNGNTEKVDKLFVVADGKAKLLLSLTVPCQIRGCNLTVDSGIFVDVGSLQERSVNEIGAYSVTRYDDIYTGSLQIEVDGAETGILLYREKWVSGSGEYIDSSVEFLFPREKMTNISKGTGFISTLDTEAFFAVITDEPPVYEFDYLGYIEIVPFNS